MAHPVRPHSYIKMDNFYTGQFVEQSYRVSLRMSISYFYFPSSEFCFIGFFLVMTDFSLSYGFGW